MMPRLAADDGSHIAQWLTGRARWVAAATAVLLLLLAPGHASAHGDTHRVLGTVTRVGSRQLTVKTTAGPTVLIAIDARTKVSRGGRKATLETLRVGERISVDADDLRGVLVAQAIRLGGRKAD